MNPLRRRMIEDMQIRNITLNKHVCARRSSLAKLHTPKW
jgi:hypothetical protein